MEELNLNNAILYADSARGVYIPQHFAKTIERQYVEGVDLNDLDLLAKGPNDESVSDIYWDVWTEILDRAKVTDGMGVTYLLHQDGDLWLVPESNFEMEG
jgi:hypothetical protein